MIYRDELERLASAGDGFEVIHTLTRTQPEGWTGYTRRVDAAMLSDVGWSASAMPASFVCGPTPFVEAVASALVRSVMRRDDQDRTLRTDGGMRWTSWSTGTRSRACSASCSSTR